MWAPFLFEFYPTRLYHCCMSSFENRKESKALYKLVGDLFAVSASYQSGTNITLCLLPRYNKNQSVQLLNDRLKLAGYTYKLE